jgi:hypothetical protein
MLKAEPDTTSSVKACGQSHEQRRSVTGSSSVLRSRGCGLGPHHQAWSKAEASKRAMKKAPESGAFSAFESMISLHF